MADRGHALLAPVRIERIALAALTGNVLVQQLPQLPEAHLLTAFTAMGLLLIVGLPRGRRLLPGVVLVAFAGTTLAALQRLEARWPSDAAASVDVTGWIDGSPAEDPARTVFTLRTVQAGPAALPLRLRLSWYDVPYTLRAGDCLALTVRLRSPRGLVNPGGFDYERWLFAQRIGATGYVRDGSAVGACGDSVARRWLRFRHGLADEIGSAIRNDKARALLVALALGIRDGFDEREWRVLRRTGTSHLVAISGLHVGLVAGGIFRIVLGLCLIGPPMLAARAWNAAAGAALLGAVGYSALAGFTMPTVRALLMLAVALMVVVSRRRVQPLAGIAVALLAVLLVDPLATLTASFWLSFSAVAAILWFVVRPGAAVGSAPRSRRLRAWSGFLLLGRIQLVLGVALLPLTAIFFGEISLAGFIVNLIAVPVFGIVLVPVSIALTALAVVGHGLTIAAPTASFVGTVVWGLLSVVSDLSLAAVSVAAPGRVLTAAIAVVCITLLVGRWWLRVAALPILLLTLAWPAQRPAAGDVAVTVLDVGHGLATIVRTAHRTLLYDTGPVARSGFDAGSEVVVPALRQLSSAGLDLIIVSHGDSDHAGGLSAVLDAYPQARVLAGGGGDSVVGRRCVAGEDWVWDGVQFAVLHPAHEFAADGNDGSCVLRVSGRGGSVLLTGDIERRGENAVVRQGLEPVDVLLAPHHGSTTSSTPRFVAASAPALVIASTAHANRWQFPRPEVIERWRSVGARVLATSESGAITVRLGGHGLIVDAARVSRRRYWMALPGTSTGSAL